MPVFSKVAPGCEESYDTLDDIDLGGSNTVDALHAMLAGAVAGTVGVCIAGQNALCDANDGYWGRALLLNTGEHMQVRVCPRGSAAQPVGKNDSRMISTRRTSINSIPVVASMIVFQPRSCSFTEGANPMTCASTIGCRGVHMLLPSLFNKHASLRNPSFGYASIDPEGFHSVRPSTICVSTRVQSRKGLHFSMTPGYAYLTIAAHLFGVDLPDPLTRSAEVVSDNEHSRNVVAKQRRMVKAIGQSKTGVAIASSLTVTDLLSVEGLCGLLCHSFFQGVYGWLEHRTSSRPLTPASLDSGTYGRTS